MTDTDADTDADTDTDTSSGTDMPLTGPQPQGLVFRRPKLEPFEREAADSEEVTTPSDVLFELRRFTGGRPIEYDPCSNPWSSTRALHANMLSQYKQPMIKLATDENLGAQYKFNFPGRVTYGDGLAKPFPADGLTYVFPGRKVRKVAQWLRKVRTESILHRAEVKNGQPFTGEVVMLVPAAYLHKPIVFDYVWEADAVCFLRDPLWFVGDEKKQQEATVVVYYGYRRGRFRRTFKSVGRVMRRCDTKYAGPRKLEMYDSAPAKD